MAAEAGACAPGGKRLSGVLAPLAFAEAVLFVLTMALASRPATRVTGEYVGTAFHLALLPIVAAVPLSPIWQGTGLAWIVCDVVASVGLIWAGKQPAVAGPAAFTSVRMAGHLFAAVWIALASYSLGSVGMAVGFPLALGFAGYTLAAGRLPEKALAVPGVLMLGWLLLLAYHFHQTAF